MTDTEREEARRLYIQAYQRRQYARRKAEGKCTSCGKQLDEHAQTLKCSACQERANAATRKYWQTKKRRLLKTLREVIQ